MPLTTAQDGGFGFWFSWVCRVSFVWVLGLAMADAISLLKMGFFGLFLFFQDLNMKMKVDRRSSLRLGAMDMGTRTFIALKL